MFTEEILVISSAFANGSGQKLNRFKGMVHPKINIVMNYSHVIPNL